MILCGDPREQFLSHREEIEAAIRRVLESGRYILGPEVEAFEEEFAAWCGAKFAIGVGSGTEALHIALAAAGIGDGDEVVTVAHTAVATASAIRMAGAVPVYVDIDPITYTMDRKLVEAAITPKTRAIIPVHLYGQPAEIEAIQEIARRHSLQVIEDCAQAHGARSGGRMVGSIGDAGCFSFYPTKNLGAIGDGGAIVTSSEEIAKAARLIREYGWADRYVSARHGWNSRLDPIQAAILRVKLRTLDADNARRREIAAIYRSSLADVPELTLPHARSEVEHVFHLFVVAADRRDELVAHLRMREVGALVHYPVPIHLQPGYESPVSLPETERAARRVLSLPMYPELTMAHQEQVVAGVRAFFE